MLLQLLSKATDGEEYFIGKKRKPLDRVRFVQLIMDNIDYLTEIGYLSSKEEAFLFKLASFVEFKTNVIVERETGNPASPTYLGTMNSLFKRRGTRRSNNRRWRVCTSRTWFVNPNIMCCRPKDGIGKATQHIFRDSLRNFKVGIKERRNIHFLFISFKRMKIFLAFFFYVFPFFRCHKNMTSDML